MQSASRYLGGSEGERRGWEGGRGEVHRCAWLSRLLTQLISRFPMHSAVRGVEGGQREEGGSQGVNPPLSLTLPPHPLYPSFAPLPSLPSLQCFVPLS